MKIDIATLFPEMCEAVLSESIIGRARKSGILDITCHNIRSYTTDKHRRVDDSPYGGGMGMVMQAQPIFNCYKSICENLNEKPRAIYLSPQGEVLTQQKCRELAKEKHLFLLCGHYEGVDERVLEKLDFEEISVGDYVLTGGELPALILVDAVSRMCDGVLSAEECFTEESHFSGLLEYPQYTRPEIWEEKPVPEVLLSGHHANIQKWRKTQSLLRTKTKRPDMFSALSLTEKELNSLEKEEKK